MQNLIKYSAIPVIASGLCLSLSAQTVFDNGDATDSFIENAANWDNGAPSAANPGTISIDANVGLQTSQPMVDWVVTQTGGNITPGGFPNLAFVASGGSWTMDGGSMTQRSHSYSNGHVFTINNGSITTVNNSTIQADDAQMVVNGGTVNADRGIRVTGGGNLTVNGGNIISDTNDAFGSAGFGGNGTLNFNGGTTTAGRLTFQGGSDLATFGGSSAGTASFTDWGADDNADRNNDNNITIDFLSGTGMTLSMGGATRALEIGGNTATVAWAEELWNNDQLLFDGQSASDLTIAWSDASSSASGLGGGVYFDFTPNGTFGGDLTLAVPEPSTFALLAGLLGFTCVMLRRRK
jgi:hypothetical protein